jgi:uncharacterized repeat protein (TIGR03806 family)
MRTTLVQLSGSHRVAKFKFTIQFTAALLFAAALPGWAASITREANTTLRLPTTPSLHAYALVNAFPDVEFTDPVAIVTPPGENNKIFVVQQDGRIILINNLNAPTRSVFLDLSDKVSYGNPNEEGGTLGIAFHPNYAQNGFFYVYYLLNTSTADGSGRHDRLSRFTRSKDNPNRADASSEVVLFTQFDEEFNHNGGTLLFGPDGYLYVSLGDEGYPQDPFDNGQRIDKDFFSGVFRIDVDKKAGNLPPNPHAALGGKTNYFVPKDNPWVNATSFNGLPVDPDRVRTEFWAVGLRSPWRMSYDPPTGTWYASEVGEVGNNAAHHSEEINLIVKGGNYGWPWREADQPGPKAVDAVPGFSALEPLVTYERGISGPFQGTAAIGGYVQRGGALPELNGLYIFGDYASGNIWALRHSGNSVQEWRFLTAASQWHIVSFAPDPRTGDILICDVVDDQIKRLVAVPSAERPPALLSDTGAFADLGTLTPNPGIVPYDINVSFWSDGADKRRWFSIPDPNARFTPAGQGMWNAPVGTVWIKHFDLELVKGDPNSARRVETRFIVRHEEGIYGVTYEWNDAQDNAVLVPVEGKDRAFTINDNGTLRQQTWHFPGQNECNACHTPAGGLALGFNAAQMNRSFHYDNGNDNQLRVLQRAGYFRGAAGGARALVPMENTRASVESRVRSYLAANCSQCHQPDGPARANIDLRYSTPTARAGLVNGPLADNMGNPSFRVIKPGSPENSVLLQRIATTDPHLRMPPVASRVVDDEAVNLITTWVNSMRAKHEPLSVRITGPKGLRTRSEVVTVRGVARGDSLDHVVFSLNGEPEQNASGAGSWSADIVLVPGKNTLVVTAIDSFGARSRSVRRIFNYKP